MAAAVALAVGAQNAPTDSIQHAVRTVAFLHDAMLDPASFVLDGAFVTKPVHRFADKAHKDQPTYCYRFRSHNPMGGYSEGAAYEDPLDHGNLEIVQPSDDGAFPGYDTGWAAPCKARNLAEDITAQVAAAAPALYQKLRYRTLVPRCCTPAMAPCLDTRQGAPGVNLRGEASFLCGKACRAWPCGGPHWLRGRGRGHR